MTPAATWSPAPTGRARRPRESSRSSTTPPQFGLTIFRTQLFNPADLPNVVAIQKGYSAQPLSAFAHTPPPPAAPAIAWPVFDKDKVKTDFFSYLNFVMQFTPPVPEEADMRARFAKIGIEPGKPFDLSKLSDAQKAAVLLGMKAGEDEADKARAALGDKVNGWQISKIENNRAAINGDWAKRAAIAKAGIYANDYFEAMYPLRRRRQQRRRAGRIEVQLHHHLPRERPAAGERLLVDHHVRRQEPAADQQPDQPLSDQFAHAAGHEEESRRRGDDLCLQGQSGSGQAGQLAAGAQ